jgi:hypothetical protein
LSCQIPIILVGFFLTYILLNSPTPTITHSPSLMFDLQISDDFPSTRGG